MTTDLVTVAEEDPVELAANLMDWHRIRQVLGRGHGAPPRRARVVPADPSAARQRPRSADLADIAVGDVMKRDPVSVRPIWPRCAALELMRSFGIGALPVVVEGQLVGIVTEHDFMDVAGTLLLEQLDQAHP